MRNFSRHNLQEMLEFLLLKMMDIAVLVSLGNFGKNRISELQVSGEKNTCRYDVLLKIKFHSMKFKEIR